MKDNLTDAQKAQIVSDPFYTATKVDLHSWLREEIAQGCFFPITVLAPTVVWGPGDQVYIPLILRRLKAGQMMYFTGAEPVEMVYIDDLVDGVLLCFFNKRACNKEYIISGPARFTFEEYIAKLAEFGGLPAPRLRVPIGLALGMASVLEATARVVNLFQPSFQPLLTRLEVRLLSMPLGASTEKARKELGYSPEVDFSKGIDGVKEYVRQVRSTLG